MVYLVYLSIKGGVVLFSDTWIDDPDVDMINTNQFCSRLRLLTRLEPNVSLLWE